MRMIFLVQVEFAFFLLFAVESAAVMHYQEYNNFVLKTKLTTAWIMSAEERDRTLI